jgi:hypothetical protein
VVAHLRYGDGLASPEMVCSTAFDRDDEFFATAGVSRHVKVRPPWQWQMRTPLLQRCGAFGFGFESSSLYQQTASAGRVAWLPQCVLLCTVLRGAWCYGSKLLLWRQIRVARYPQAVCVCKDVQPPKFPLCVL